MASPPLSRTAPVDISDRAKVRIMTYRRRRILRGGGLFVAGSLIMILMALANRDAQERRGGADQAEKLVAILQRAYENSGYPPQRFPDEAAKQNIPTDQYYFNSMYSSQAGSGGTVGVCYRDQDLFLSPDGYYVTLFAGGHYRWEWMEDQTFKQRAAQLGFRAP
jgi:hypothetical protein